MKSNLITLFLVSSSLAGCGGSGSSSSEPAPSAVAVTHMSTPEAGMQSMQTIDSKLVYRGDNAQKNISFTGDNFQTVLSPDVTEMVDINTKYAVIMVNKITVRAYGKKVTLGEATLIQNKETGELTPIYLDGEPYYEKNQPTKEQFRSSVEYTSSYNSIESMIFEVSTLIDEEARLGMMIDHVTVYNEDAQIFELKPVTEHLPEESGRVVGTLSNGDIIVSYSDALGGHSSWIRDGVEHKFNVEQQHSISIYEDSVVLTDTTSNVNSNLFIELELIDGEVVQGNVINKLIPHNYYFDGSLIRNGYEMRGSCEVYRHTLGSIDEVEFPYELSEHAAIVLGGQKAIFCSDGKTVIKFDTEIEQFTKHEYTNQDNWFEAFERSQIVSDNEIMFEVIDYDSHNHDMIDEYYYNFETNEETTKRVNQKSVARLQRMKIDL
ncbi:hypothetical protein KI655_17450 [Vibrio sp. D404a]|uniref:hypothetical protein n=1 Tax=unclassified Vibrio TaxID=2614977 RepID=UPI002554B119|nr:MULTISPECIES: hypothetical protein [unclassified Vibrio]MDK9739089.1 hypothetical protein [Vibrio sp. D404a]MDK9796586.1 hypothetical protein [Vibrio sp. D449a]